MDKIRGIVVVCLFLFTTFFSEAKEHKTIISEAYINELWSQRHSIKSQDEFIHFGQNQPDISSDSFEVNWKMARAMYFIGNFGFGENFSCFEKQLFFKYGVMVAQKAKELKPKAVEGFYWYGVNLWYNIQCKGILNSLDSASGGIEALEEASHINPSYEGGGPFRMLGLYYLGSGQGSLLGSPSKENMDKAKSYFIKSLQLGPNFLVNYLYLARVYELEGNYKEAIKVLAKAPSLNTQSKSRNLKKDDIIEEEYFRQKILEKTKKLRKKL